MGKSRSNRHHNKSGASIALVIVCAGILIILLIGCFKLAMIMGAAQELNYTADAAALNVAKRSMEITANPNPGIWYDGSLIAGTSYSDCALASGGISLANINRVWGKAYLINANVEEFVQNNKSTDQATRSADLAYSSAQAVNDDLDSRLNFHPTLFSFFNQIAGLRFLKMVNNTPATSSTAADWLTAPVYRGAQSNLAFSPMQILATPASHLGGGISIGNQTFMQGYTPVEANNKPFYFVAFHAGEMPHLISESLFRQNLLDENSIAEIKNPLPNAFSGYGLAANSLNSHAFAIANPLRQYNLSIPHAFISIHLANIANWIVQGKTVNITSYGFAPETQWGAKNIPLGNNSYLDGYASLGNEPKGTLWDYFQSIQGDNSKVLWDMAQRLSEIKLDFTQANLQQLMQQQPVLANTDTYLIYPSYTTPDNTNPTVQLTPFNNQTIKSLPRWINPNDIAANEAQSRVYLQQQPSNNSPNYNWEMVYGPGYKASDHWIEEGGELDWQPGTGANQTLGQVSVVHNTYCYFTAQSNQPPPR